MNKFEEKVRKRNESNAKIKEHNANVYKLFMKIGNTSFCDDAAKNEVLKKTLNKN